MYLCSKDSESFLIRDYFKNFYRVKDIDFYDSVDVNEEIFNDEILMSILTENMDMLRTKAWRLPLPKDYLVISSDSGDMNGDGFDDHAVVLEKLPGFSCLERKIYVFLSKGEDDFTVLKDANHLVLGANEGGVFEDPFLGLDIEEGVLSVGNYGGSSDRWGFEYFFKFLEGRLQMVESDYISHSTHSGSEIEIANDYINGISKLKSYSFQEEFDGLLIASSSIEPKESLYFDTVFSNDQCIFEAYGGDAEYFPSLYGIVYGQPYWNGELKHTSEEILDYAAAYLNFQGEKTQYSYPNEILEVYSKLMSYEMPKYFYENDTKILWYDGIVPWCGEDRVIHRVYLCDKESNQRKSLTLYTDEDGYIVIEDE